MTDEYPLADLEVGQLSQLVGKRGMPKTLRELLELRNQQQQAKAKAVEANRAPQPRVRAFKSAREVLEFRQVEASGELAASLPVVDGAKFLRLHDEEAALRARIAAIREEMAEMLAPPPGSNIGLGRKHVLGRKNFEDLVQDAAIMVLARHAAAFGEGRAWPHALATIYRGAFGWVPTVPFWLHKARRK